MTADFGMALAWPPQTLSKPNSTTSRTSPSMPKSAGSATKPRLSWRGSLLSGGRYMRHERPLGSGNGSGYPHPDSTATSGVGARAAVTPVSTRASVQRIPALHAEQPVAA